MNNNKDIPNSDEEKIILLDKDGEEYEDLSKYIQGEFLGHCIYREGIEESQKFLHKILNNIYDHEKIKSFFNNDNEMLCFFYFMLEKYNIIKCNSNLIYIFKLTGRGLDLLELLNKLYGEIEDES